MKTVYYGGDVNRASDDARQFILGDGAQGAWGRARQVGPYGYGAFGGSGLFSPSYGPMSYSSFAMPQVPRMPSWMMPSMMFMPPMPTYQYGPPPGTLEFPPSWLDPAAPMDSMFGLSGEEDLDIDDGLGFWEALGSGLTSLGSGISSGVSTLGSGLTSLGSTVGGGLTSAVQGLPGILQSLGSTVGGGISDISGSLGGVVQNLAPAIGKIAEGYANNKIALANVKAQQKLDKAQLKLEIERAKALAKINPALVAGTPTAQAAESGSWFKGGKTDWMPIALAVGAGALLITLMNNRK